MALLRLSPNFVDVFMNGCHVEKFMVTKASLIFSLLLLGSIFFFVLTTYTFMADKVCGCNVITSAGVVTSLQLVVMVLTLSSAGLILDRDHLWQAIYPRVQYNATAQAAANGTLKFNASNWAQAWVELGQAWYVGFGAYWLFSILILVLSFKYYRPVFVIPNFTALVVGCFMNLFEFAVLLARILCVSKAYRTQEYEESIYIYVMGLSLFAFICCVLFIIFISKYHKFLRNRYGHQVPKFVQSRARTGYHDEAY